MKQIRRQQRHNRLRSKVSGTAERPRVSIFRSSRRVTLQLIDDTAHKTITSLAGDTTKKQTKTDQAKEAGLALAAAAKAAGVTRVVFDRSGYKYHGRVKAVADALREGGLDF